MIRLCLVVFIRSYLISTYFYEKTGHTLVSLFFFLLEISWKNTFFLGKNWKNTLYHISL